MKRSVTLLLFEDAEVLDFAGPFEVFSVTNELHAHELMTVKTVSVDGQRIRAKNGLSVNVDASIHDVTSTDILIVPGGRGSRELVHNQQVIAWITQLAPKAELVLSVCTGALLLAQAGLLKHKVATTHAHGFELLANIDPSIRLEKNVRFVDNGKVITSAGISAGIDMSLHVMERLYGQEVRAKTAAYMEYRDRS